MRKVDYPSLDDDKILDAPPGLDAESLGARRGPSPDRARARRTPRRPLAWRVLRVLIPFILGIAAGVVLYNHLTASEDGEGRTGSITSWFTYPVSGLRLERSSVEGGAVKSSSPLLVVPGGAVTLRYGKESLRLVAIERRSSLWASALIMFIRPPEVYLDQTKIEPGREISGLLQPEKALGYTLDLRPSDREPSLASFRVELEMDARGWLERARALKDPQAQRMCMEEAARRDPENLEILMALGNLLWEQKDPNAAAQRFQEILRENPNHVEAAKALATIFWKSQPKRALEAYETLAKIDPDHRVEHYKYVAQLQERLGVSPAETYRKILALQKNDPDARRGLDGLYTKNLGKAQQFENKGDLQKAINEMKQAMELHPSKEGQAYLATLYNNLAFSLAQKGQFKEAIPNYEASLKLDENAVTCVNLADAYAKTNQVPSALKAVEKAYNLKPKDQAVVKNILLLWAELLVAKKDYGQAVPKLEELQTRYPKDPQISKSLGTAYWNKGDLSKALDTLKGIPPLIAKQPPKEQADIYRMVGDLHRSLGDQEKNVKGRISRYDQALQAYKQALALNKGDKELQKRKDDLDNERMALVKRSLKSQ
jgi:tetratricopeptide (TPR) repeat protein